MPLFAVPAWAQQATAANVPQTTTANYQDWTLRCDNAVGTLPHKACEVVQTVAASDGKTALAHIVSTLSSASDADAVGSATMNLGMPISLNVVAPFQRCDCSADRRLGEIEAFGGTGVAGIAFLLARAPKAPGSMTGLTVNSPISTPTNTMRSNQGFGSAAC